jgi:hypothetical protein
MAVVAHINPFESNLSIAVALSLPLVNRIVFLFIQTSSADGLLVVGGDPRANL